MTGASEAKRAIASKGKSKGKAASTGQPKAGSGGGGSNKTREYPHVVRVRVLGLAGVVVNNESREGGEAVVLPPAKMRAAITLSRDDAVQGASHMSLPLSRSPNEDIVTATNVRDDASSVAASSLVSRIRRGTSIRAYAEKGAFEVSAGGPAPVERYLAVWEQGSQDSDETVLTFETNLRRCESERKKNLDEESMVSSIYAPKSFDVTIALAPESEGTVGSPGEERRKIAFPLGVATLAISGDECIKDGRAPRQVDVPVLSLEQARPLAASNEVYPIIDLGTVDKTASLQILDGEESVPTEMSDEAKPLKKGKTRLKKALSNSFRKLKKKKGKEDSPKMTLKRQREAFASRYAIDSSGDAVLRLSVEVFEKGSDPNLEKMAVFQRHKATQRLEALEEKQTNPERPIEATAAAKDLSSELVVQKSEAPDSNDKKEPGGSEKIDAHGIDNERDRILDVGDGVEDENGADNCSDAEDENGSADTGAGSSTIFTDEDGSQTCETMTTATLETRATLEDDTLASTKASGLTDEKNTALSKSSRASKGQKEKKTKKKSRLDDEDEDTIDTSPTFVTRQIFGQDILVPAVAVEATEHIKTIAREAREQYNCTDRSPDDKNETPTSQKSRNSMGLLVDTLMAGCVSPVCAKEGSIQGQGGIVDEAQRDINKNVNRGEAATTGSVAGEDRSRIVAERLEDDTMDTAGDDTMDSRDDGTFESSLRTKSMTAQSDLSSPRGVKDLENVSERGKESAYARTLSLKQSQKECSTGSSPQKVSAVLQTIADVLTCRLHSPHPDDEINLASYDEEGLTSPPAIIHKHTDVSIGDLTDNTFECDPESRKRRSRSHWYEVDRFNSGAVRLRSEEPMQPAKAPLDLERGPTGRIPLPVAFGGDGLCVPVPIATLEGKGRMKANARDVVKNSKIVANLDEDYFADYNVLTSKDFPGDSHQDLQSYNESHPKVGTEKSNPIDRGSAGDDLESPPQIAANDSDATDDDRYTARAKYSTTPSSLLEKQHTR